MKGLLGLIQRKAVPRVPGAPEMLDFLRTQADPARFSNVADRIRSRFHLYHRGAWNPYGTPDPEKRATELVQLAETPELAEVFLFHGDGFVREAALRTLSGPIRLPVVTYGLLERLNDWSPEVRSAAQGTFARCFDLTPAEILFPALSVALRNTHRWGRWQDGYDALIAAIMQHEGLVAAFLTKIMSDQGAQAGTIFHALRRNPGFDIYLARIAVAAKKPQLRASALDSLVRGKAFWRLGTTQKVWIDKSLGLYKLKPNFASRSLSVSVDLLTHLQTALGDRSAQVRLIALDGLIALRNDERYSALVAECLASLSDGDRPSIRGRLDYLRQNMPKLT